MTEVSPEEWGHRYRNMRGTCEALTGRLRTLAVDLLAEANIDVIQIEARTKDVDSFTEKIGRKRAKYKNPRVGKEIYGKVYSGDWGEFAAKTEAWHGRKRQREGS